MNRELAQVHPLALEAADISAVMGGQKTLDVPSLQVYPKETLAFIGPNGSGKTTLILCLALLLKPATGRVSYPGISDVDSGNLMQMRRRLAVVFQDPLLLNATVLDNVILGLKLRGVQNDEIKVRAQRWLKRFGISDLAERNAKTLSGGEAKRASLARAFVLQPEVLFLDEPFNGLDNPTRQSLLEDFGGVLHETGTTTVMVTHDQNEALMLADRVAVIMKGSIRQIGTPCEVFSCPVDEEVACFVGVENVLTGVVSSQVDGIATVSVEQQMLAVVSSLPAGARVLACLRPEDITLTVPSPAAPLSSARNQLSGKIVKVFPVGAQVRVTVDCGFPLVVLITGRSYEDMGLEMGRPVTASFKASSIHLIAKH